jgi:hypothetical protein
MDIIAKALLCVTPFSLVKGDKKLALAKVLLFAVTALGLVVLWHALTSYANAAPVCNDRTGAYELTSADLGGAGNALWPQEVAAGDCANIKRPIYLRTLTSYQIEVLARAVEHRYPGKNLYGLLLSPPPKVWAVEWRPEYAQNAPEWQEWFKRAEVTKRAQSRFNWKSCCEHADRVKTQYRVNRVNGEDEWWFLDPKTDKWVAIPEYVIHFEDDATMPKQLKAEGVLFVYNGIVTCFWPPEGGG